MVLDSGVLTHNTAEDFQYYHMVSIFQEMNVTVKYLQSWTYFSVHCLQLSVQLQPWQRSQIHSVYRGVIGYHGNGTTPECSGLFLSCSGIIQFIQEEHPQIIHPSIQKSVPLHLFKKINMCL